jgi:hypothetical protein
MANDFKRHIGTGSTTGTTIYTVPTSAVDVVIGLTLANKTSDKVYASITIAGYTMLNEAPIPAGSTLSALDGKIIMEAGDSLVATTDVDNAVDVILSVLEQT